MALKGPNKIEVEQPNTQRAIDSTNDCLERVIAKEIVDGVLITDVALLAGVPAQVGHGLGRQARGRIVVAQDAAATLVDGGTNDRTWTVTASVDVTASFWFF